MAELQPGFTTETRLQRHQKRRSLNRRRSRYLLLTTGAILTVLLALALFAWYQYPARAESEVYFTALFTEGLGDWTALDARWDEEELAARLARREYAAPHLMLHLSTAQSPPEDFVWHLPVRVSRFTGEAMVLGAIFLPGGPLAVVVNSEGRLGIARDLFAPPDYGAASPVTLSTDKWVDVYVHINSREEQVELYLDSRRVLTTSLVEPTFPVMEVWLGALWLGGAGNYGAPLDVSYKGVTFGNEGLLPQPGLWEFLRTLPQELISMVAG